MPPFLPETQPISIQGFSPPPLKTVSFQDQGFNLTPETQHVSLQRFSPPPEIQPVSINHSSIQGYSTPPGYNIPQVPLSSPGW